MTMMMPPSLVVMLVATAVALVPAAALATPAAQDGGESARVETGAGAAAGEALVVQVDHVVPEYKGGDKFRSPPTIDTALAQDLARRLQVPLQVRPTAGGQDAAGALRLTSLRDLSEVPRHLSVVPIDYRTVPMAIMRSDTTIKRWEQLQGRRVCVAAGGHHVGTVAGRYGAVEQLHRTTTDALIALRVGDCDAMVHDSTMLEELIRFPEWKKFSARLRGNQRSTLALLVPTGDQARVQAVRRVAYEWDAAALPDRLVKRTVRDIAFEVYLEQEVPDCH
jgi:polar amino acid transport system substrate-binding protein